MKKIYLTLILGMFLIFSASAASELSPVKQNSCINLIQTCSSCSYNNLTSVVYPNGSKAIGTTMMTADGSEYTYEFCNTSLIGKYQVNGLGDINGVAEVWQYSFDVTPSGFIGTLGFYIIILILSLGIIILGFSIRDGWTVVLGSFGFVLLGLFIILYGIDGLKDTAYTWGIGIITTMVGAYFGVKSSMEMLE